jgi:hypothetical protein
VLVDALLVKLAILFEHLHRFTFIPAHHGGITNDVGEHYYGNSP